MVTRPARFVGLALAVARRRLLRVAVVAGAVVVVRVQVGVWPAAVVGAVAATVGLIAALAAWDRRALRAEDRPRARARAVEVVQVGPRRPGVVGPGVDGPGGHVAFARGLAGLAAWYLAECEQEVQR